MYRRKSDHRPPEQKDWKIHCCQLSEERIWFEERDSPAREGARDLLVFLVIPWSTSNNSKTPERKDQMLDLKTVCIASKVTAIRKRASSFLICFERSVVRAEGINPLKRKSNVNEDVKLSGKDQNGRESQALLRADRCLESAHNARACVRRESLKRFLRAIIWGRR